MRGMADVNEVTRLRAEIDGLRQEMLHMANRYESLEVIKAAAMKLMAFLYTHTHTHSFLHLPCTMWVSSCCLSSIMSCQLEVDV